MPIFEYQCNACAYKFEELVSSNTTPVVCPRCNATDTRKLLSVFAASGGGESGSTGFGSGCGGAGFG